MHDAPLASIILATYNRSNVLKYSIDSVVGQSMPDWELIVVGDCCTDDTEAVVANFQDARISFLNLPENFGEQSRPNNEGLQRARGKYIAFLNHDDLWFPDHLERCVSHIESSEADMVLAAGFIDTKNSKTNFTASGVMPPGTGYHPGRVFVPASNWLFRRELIAEIGYWRPASELYLVPSHDWIKRVFEAKKTIVPTRCFTVLAAPSGFRPNAYRDRHFEENERYHNRLKDNPWKLREELLSTHHYDWVQRYFFDEKTYYLRFFRTKWRAIQRRLGINPLESIAKKRFGKGGSLKKLRTTRGLPPK